MMIDLLSKVKFFKDRNIVKKGDYAEICKALQLETFKENEMVFDYGTQGDKFYIILSGSVNVWVPYYVAINREEKIKRQR